MLVYQRVIITLVHIWACRCPTHHCRVGWFSSMKSSYNKGASVLTQAHQMWLMKVMKTGDKQKNVMVNHHGESWVVPVTQSHSNGHVISAELRCHANAFEDPRRHGSSQAGPERLPDPGGLGLGVGGLVIGPEWPRYCQFKDFHGSLPAKMVSS